MKKLFIGVLIIGTLVGATVGYAKFFKKKGSVAIAPIESTETKTNTPIAEASASSTTTTTIPKLDITVRNTPQTITVNNTPQKITVESTPQEIDINLENQTATIPKTIKINVDANNNYFIYVPSKNAWDSSCEWKWNNNKSLTTTPDPKTGRNQFKHTNSMKNFSVKCTDDQNNTYKGKF